MKIASFSAGLILGGLAVFCLCRCVGIVNPVKSQSERALADRIESISIEKICASIASGKQILGDDHVIEAVSVEKVDPKKTQGGWKKS